MNQLVKYLHQELKDIYSVSEIDVISIFLLEKLTGMSRTQLLINKGLILNEDQKNTAMEYTNRLKDSEPLQYVLGETEFLGLTFKVNPSVLIPRPETEELVEWILEDWDNKQAFSLLDIGTGSGCIPISVKHNRPNAAVYAVDLSKDALEVAMQNAKLNQTLIHFTKDDILIPTHTYQTYDVIVSNPPYIPQEEQENMDANVVDYEPKMALFVKDDDPLLFYKRIAEFAKKHLDVNGTLYFETHYQLANQVKSVLLKCGFKDVIIRKDISKNDRMIRAKR